MTGPDIADMLVGGVTRTRRARVGLGLGDPGTGKGGRRSRTPDPVGTDNTIKTIPLTLRNLYPKAHSTIIPIRTLVDQNTRATRRLDPLLGRLGEELGLDHEGHGGETALAENLEVPVLGNVHHEGLALLSLGGLDRGVATHERPDLLHVDHGAVELVHRLVEVTHTHLPEVTGVVLVEVDAHVVLATGVTASVGMLAVLADTPVTHGHVPAELPRLLKAYTSKVHIQCLGGVEWDTFGRYQGNQRPFFSGVQIRSEIRCEGRYYVHMTLSVVKK